MKKSILNLGKALNKSEQEQINGGKPIECYSNPICPPYGCCIVYGSVCEVIDEGSCF
jgi:hypothetical protein